MTNQPPIEVTKRNTVAMADALMAIFGFKRKVIVDGNVIIPIEFEEKP